MENNLSAFPSTLMVPPHTLLKNALLPLLWSCLSTVVGERFGGFLNANSGAVFAPRAEIDAVCLALLWAHQIIQPYLGQGPCPSINFCFDCLVAGYMSLLVIGLRGSMLLSNMPIVLLCIGLKPEHSFTLAGSTSLHILGTRGMKPLMPLPGPLLPPGFLHLSYNLSKTGLLDPKYIGFGLWTLPPTLVPLPLMESCRSLPQSLSVMYNLLNIILFINVKHLSIYHVSTFLSVYDVRLPMFWPLVALASLHVLRLCFAASHRKTSILWACRKLDHNSMDIDLRRTITFFLPLPPRKVLEGVKFGSKDVGPCDRFHSPSACRLAHSALECTTHCRATQ